MDRVKLIDLLHRLGLAAQLIRALASTFHLNSCRLRIEGFLSDAFPVNLGVREGDIDFPPMFNLVYSEILRLCGLDLLDDDAFIDFCSRVQGVAYADDLAALCVHVPLL